MVTATDIQVLCSRTEATAKNNIMFWLAFNSNLMGHKKFCCKASTFILFFLHKGVEKNKIRRTEEREKRD